MEGSSCALTTLLDRVLWSVFYKADELLGL